MSIEVQNTVDFFYLGGVVQGLTRGDHTIAASISTGLVGVVAAINLRDRLISYKSKMDLVITVASLAVEILQVMSGVLTGIGTKSLYHASLSADVRLATLSIVAIFSGACLSFVSLQLHRWIPVTARPPS